MMSTATPTMKILLSVLEEDPQGDSSNGSPQAASATSSVPSVPAVVKPQIVKPPESMRGKDPLTQSGLRRLTNGELAAANKKKYTTLRLKLEELGVDTDEDSAETCYNEAERLFRRSQSVKKLDLSDKS